MNDQDKKAFFELLNKWFDVSITVNASYPTSFEDRKKVYATGKMTNE